MARELGMRPKSLIKNIPARSQQWNMPVSEWVRSLYEKKIGSRRQAGGAPGSQAMQNKVIEFRNPEYPWPDRLKIPELVLEDPFEFEGGEGFGVEWHEHSFPDSFEPPSEGDISEENTLMLRRQCLFRWAAQSIAVAMSKLPEVQKVAAFGAVARPLEMEVPRFRQLRRHRIEVLHECADLDLAVWTTGLSALKELKRAISRGLSFVQDTPYGGVAHHQVDVHVLNAQSGDYGGRLCIFGECPKPGKRECFVPGCGAQPFLQQFKEYRFNPAQFESEPRVTLFDRTSGFLVHPPRIDAKPTRFVHRARNENFDYDDPPF